MWQRTPRRGLKQQLGPPAGEQPSAEAEIHVLKMPVDSEVQVIPALDPASRIVNMLRRAGLGAVVRIVVPSGEASQMLTTIERITITPVWAITVTSTLVIATAASLSATAIIAIIAIELTGFVIALLAARRRRRRKS